MAQPPVPLWTLRPGEVAEVHSVAGKPDHVRRLHELGFQSGVLLEMVRNGSTCIVQLAGCKLCFRAAELLEVFVRTRASA